MKNNAICGKYLHRKIPFQNLQVRKGWAYHTTYNLYEEAYASQELFHLFEDIDRKHI